MNGDAHDKWTLAAAIPAAVSVFHETGDATLTAQLTGLYLFSGLLMGPDLDCRSIHLRRWGPLAFVWIPYRAMDTHRGISHLPIAGTLSRLLCLSLWAAIPVIAVCLYKGVYPWEKIPAVLAFIKEHNASLIAAFCALEAGAASHYVVDTVSSTWKRLRKKSRRRQNRH